MIDERLIDLLTERLATRVQKQQEYFLMKIAESISKIGSLRPSDAQQLGQILKYGGNYDEIVNELAKMTELNIEEIYEIFDEVAKEDYHFAEQFYNYRDIKYIPYEQNIPLQRQVRALANITAQEFYNFSRTRAFIKKVDGEIIYTDLSTTYQEAIDEAVLSVIQGKDTFDRQMSKKVKELASSGMRVVNYGGKYSRRLDSAVRMNIKGGLRDMHNEIQSFVGEEFGADGVEISVHFNPAPDHANVQGRQFSNEEFHKFQTDQDSHDYKGRFYSKEFKGHDRRAISEYNCYHYVFSVVLGVSEPTYNDKQLKEIIDKNNKGFKFDGKKYTNYEGTQLQRQIETEIRKAKDTQMMAKASLPNANPKDYKKMVETIEESQERITHLTKKYKDLCKASKLPAKMDRMKVSGYARTSIKKLEERK